jgi:hypothetical protein
VLTFGRVFINSDTREGYKNLFIQFFAAVNKALPHGKTVQWLHIHGTGIRAMVSDMCSKQSAGMCFLNDNRLQHISYTIRAGRLPPLY